MDINKFIGEHCDFCDYENSKICLSCMKIITYEGVKEGTYHAFCNGKEAEVASYKPHCDTFLKAFELYKMFMQNQKFNLEME